jgi:hypothetical protein
LRWTKWRWDVFLGFEVDKVSLEYVFLGFEVDKVALGHVFLRVPWFLLASNIPFDKWFVHI